MSLQIINRNITIISNCSIKCPDLLSTEKLFEAIAFLLEEIIEENDIIEEKPFTKFCANIKPNVKIIDYLKRISKYSKCSDECFVFALILLDRFLFFNKEMFLFSLNIHRYFIFIIKKCSFKKKSNFIFHYFENN